MLMLSLSSVVDMATVIKIGVVPHSRKVRTYFYFYFFLARTNVPGLLHL